MHTKTAVQYEHSKVSYCEYGGPYSHAQQTISTVHSIFSSVSLSRTYSFNDALYLYNTLFFLRKPTTAFKAIQT